MHSLAHPKNTVLPFHPAAANEHLQKHGGFHFLLVEDSLSDAVLIKNEIARAFREGSYQVTVARSKAQAAKILAQENFDVVLLDLTLPDAVRLESLVDLQINYPNVPVIVLTGYEDEDFAVQAVGSGAQDYMVKNKATANAIRRSISYAIQRKSLEVELKEARQQAEIANRAKSDFLASMSHELRTPLNAISGFAQILLMERDKPKTAREVDYIKSILQASDHLTGLINDILDLAKVESGKVNFDLVPVSSMALLMELEHLMMPLADRKNIHLQVTSDAEYHILCDAMRLQQVLINLASNAIKYNHDGGEVMIHITESHDMARISVTDDGMGIPRTRQAEIFQPFNRLGAETTATEGTGIGLTICKNLIEEMGGKIGFESVEGYGSCFWVEMPMVPEK